MNRHVSSNRCVDQQVKFSKGNTPLLKSAMDKPTVEGMESLEDDHSEPTIDTPTKLTDFYTDLMRHMAAMCKEETLPSHAQVQVMVMTKKIQILYKI